MPKPPSGARRRKFRGQAGRGGLAGLAGASGKPAPEPGVPGEDSAAEPVSLAEAMRAIGLDERKIAGVLNLLVDNLTGDDKPDTKLLLDVLKECIKAINPEAHGAAGLDSVPVQLVHEVTRPARDDAPPPPVLL